MSHLVLLLFKDTIHHLPLHLLILLLLLLLLLIYVAHNRICSAGSDIRPFTELLRPA
jgi:hypothetical protein